MGNHGDGLKLPKHFGFAGAAPDGKSFKWTKSNTQYDSSMENVIHLADVKQNHWLSLLS